MLVFAHRGIHDRKTGENTLEAFRRAVEARVDGIEFDLRVSRDGVPVVVHDEHLDRVAGDARRIRDLTSDELGDIVLRGSGNIPTLNDVTAIVPSPILLDIEIKDRDVLKPLIAKLRTSAALRERVIVSSFVLDDLVAIRAAFPSIRTLSLNRTWPLPFRGTLFWKRLKDADVWGVGFPVNVLNHRRLAAINRFGWKTAAWDLQPLTREAKNLAKLRPDIAITFKTNACS